MAKTPCGATGAATEEPPGQLANAGFAVVDTDAVVVAGLVVDVNGANVGAGVANGFVPVAWTLELQAAAATATTRQAMVAGNREPCPAPKCPAPKCPVCHA